MILRLLWLGRLPPAASRPFLYTHLNSSSPQLPAPGKRPAGLVARILQYGETKWQDLASYPSASIRGRIYRAGSRLIDRIPMQERMLWRLHTYLSAQPANGHFAQLPPIEHGPDIAPAALRADMAREAQHWVALHRRWRLVHGMAILPAVLLSVLPFVKLWLAWEIFRTVTHHRALTAAAWLRRGLARRGTGSLPFTSNPQLAAPLTAPEAIDGELPGILRRLQQ